MAFSGGDERESPSDVHAPGPESQTSVIKALLCEVRAVPSHGLLCEVQIVDPIMYCIFQKLNPDLRTSTPHLFTQTA
jgi:hypothetical protein